MVLPGHSTYLARVRATLSRVANKRFSCVMRAPTGLQFERRNSCPPRYPLAMLWAVVQRCTGKFRCKTKLVSTFWRRRCRAACSCAELLSGGTVPLQIGEVICGEHAHWNLVQEEELSSCPPNKHGPAASFNPSINRHS